MQSDCYIVTLFTVTSVTLAVLSLYQSHCMNLTSYLVLLLVRMDEKASEGPKWLKCNVSHEIITRSQLLIIVIISDSRMLLSV